MHSSVAPPLNGIHEVSARDFVRTDGISTRDSTLQIPREEDFYQGSLTYEYILR